MSDQSKPDSSKGPAIPKVVEYLERQQDLTGREIPIVVLERVG